MTAPAQIASVVEHVAASDNAGLPVTAVRVLQEISTGVVRLSLVPLAGYTQLSVGDMGGSVVQLYVTPPSNVRKPVRLGGTSTILL